MFEFLNSQGLSTLVSALVGGIAIYLYLAQKRDTKSTAASVILMEIRNAEVVLAQIKAAGGQVIFQNLSKILPNNSLRKHAHLFVRDLDEGEMDALNNFYVGCLALDEAIRQAHSLPEQIRIKTTRIQEKLVDMACSDPENYSDNKMKFLEIVHKEDYTFQPSTPTSQIPKLVSELHPISITTVGEKLKRVARFR